MRWWSVLLVAFSLGTLVCSAQEAAQKAQPPDKLFEAQGLIARKQLDSAESVIVSELLKKPRDAAWITLLAEVRLEQRRVQDSLRLIDEANRLAGADVQRSMLASMAWSAAGRMDLAEPPIRQAVALDPSNPTAHYFLARLLYTDNRFDESIEQSMKAIALAPDYVRAYENVGLCYEGKQNPAEAEIWYHRAMDRQATRTPKSEWPLLDLGTMLLHQNRYSEAKLYLQQALEINPDNAQSLLQMGILIEKTGNPADALEKFRSAIQQDPRSAGAYYQAARICQRLGRAAEAAQYFKKFRDLNDKH